MNKNSETWVCKFGGTSLANAQQIMKVKDIIFADERRKVTVVSAPGKEHKEDTKITDLLYTCHKLASENKSIDEPFSIIRKRFLEIARTLNVGQTISQELDVVYDRIPKEKTPDYAASRGEYLNALMIAEYLDAEFVDAEQIIFLTGDGRVDDCSYDKAAERLGDSGKRYIIPGFFGSGPDGQVKTFSRGGSDITGAIAARAVSADKYENWTDVSGLYMADPRIAQHAKPVPEITYREIRELSSIGASVFHEDAIAPVRKAGIPINIKNTNDTSAPGTMITPDRDASKLKIVGVSGKKPYRKLSVERFMLDRYPETTKQLRAVLDEMKLTADVVVDAFDSMVLYLAADINDDDAQKLKDEIIKRAEPDVCEVSQPMVLLGIVGEGIEELPRLVEDVTAALREKSVYPAVIAGNTPVKMLLAVALEDYQTALNTLVDTVAAQQ
jgi:aspartate kinase